MINTHYEPTTKKRSLISHSSKKIAYAYISIHQYYAKRLFDIIFSLLVIVCILSWLLPICFILTKLDSKGPFFFVQKRVGFKGKIFNCLKIRTMVINDCSDTLQATLNDSRVTRIGKILRLTNIDELPQFINVFLGDMSVVGPRPHMRKDCADFTELIPGYCLRHSVKPGITGMAQINGFRGPTKNAESIIKRYQLDVLYIHNLNFSVDLTIIVRTIKQTLHLLLNRSSYNLNEVEEITLTPQTKIAHVEDVRKKMIV